MTQSLQFLLAHACCLVFLAPVFAQSDSKMEDWSQWRGPNRDGIISSDKWPEQLSGDTLSKSWEVKLGPSYSGPIVVGDRVFVTETVDKKMECVRALDRNTGKQIWRTEWKGSMTVPFFAKSNGDWIRSTPAFDDNRLYVAGMRDVLLCLDARNGKEIWRVDFVKQLKTPLPNFGFVCSPLVVDDAVYVQAAASFVKLDKKTGKILWRALVDEGGMNGSAFSSPVVTKIAGKRQLVVQTRTKLAGVDIENGKTLWEKQIPAFRGMNILTPSIIDDSIFTSTYGGTSMLLDLVQQNGKFETKSKWKNGKQGYMSSPVVVEGHVYLHLRNQRFTCIDLATGDVKWTTKLFGKYWSMVANGNLILALDEQGDLRLIRANPNKFDLIDTRKVADNSWAHISISGNDIFVRDLNVVSAFKWKTDKTEPAR